MEQQVWSCVDKGSVVIRCPVTLPLRCDLIKAVQLPQQVEHGNPFVVPGVAAAKIKVQEAEVPVGIRLLSHVQTLERHATRRQRLA